MRRLTYRSDAILHSCTVCSLRVMTFTNPFGPMQPGHLSRSGSELYARLAPGETYEACLARLLAHPGFPRCPADEPSRIAASVLST